MPSGLRTTLCGGLLLWTLACQAPTGTDDAIPIPSPSAEASAASAITDATPLRLFPICGDLSQAVDQGPLPTSEAPVSQSISHSQETHRYTVDVEAGEFVHLVVEQQQIDLVLGLIDERGESLIRVDSLYFDRGTEEILWKSEDATTLHLLVCGPSRVPEHGRYTAHLATRRPATTTDHQVMQAFLNHHSGEAHRRHGSKESLLQAIALLRQSAQQWKALARPHDEALSLYALGRIQFRMREDPEEAVATVEASLELLEATDDRFLQGGAHDRLGLLQNSLGNPTQAFFHYDQALALRREVGHRTGELRTLINQGRLHYNQGDNSKARDLFEEALQLAEELGQERSQANLMFQLGRYYRNLGDLEIALENFKRALRMEERLENTYNIAKLHRFLGELEKSMGRIETARSHFETALELFEEIQDTAGRIWTLNDLGLAELEEGRYELSDRYLQESLSLQEERDHNSRASTRLYLGWLIAMQNQCQDAIPEFERAIIGYEKTHDIAMLALTHESLAICHQRLENFDTALEEIKKGVSLIEFMRERTLSMSWKSKFFANRRVYYNVMVDILMSLAEERDSSEHLQMAFETSERSKARTLLDAMAAGNSKPFPDEVDEHREAARHLARRIYEHEVQRLRSTPAENEEPSATRPFSTLLEQYEIVTRKIRSQSATQETGRPLNLREVRHELGDGTTLLEFHIGHRQSHLWLVDQNRILHFRLPHRSELERLSSLAFRNLSSKARPVQTELILEQLRDKIFSNSLSEVRTRRVLVVKEGPLLYLPFETLPSSDQDPEDPSSIRRLGDDFEFVGVPSVSVLSQLRRNRAQKQAISGPRSIAIVADPVFDREDDRLASHVSRRPTLVASDNGQRAATSPRGLERLVYSHSEGTQIEDIARRNGWHAQLSVGFEATKEIVKDDLLANHRILHFATHANFNSKQPELAYLVFSQLDAGGRPIDGYLFAYELYDLSLPADTVVLSACSGALGSEIRGEGLVGLTQGFLNAGAARILVSLWQVDDQATAVLMRHFYLELLEHGAEPATALQRAKEKVRQIPGWEAPYYWAGFSLQGEWRP